MEAGREHAEPIRVSAGASPTWRQSAAWLVLTAALLAAGLYVLWGYLHALTWALVLAVALGPLYERISRGVTSHMAREILPLVFAALVGLVVLAPVATLAIDALRELEEVLDYIRNAGSSGLPVPDFIARAPIIGLWLSEVWSEHLSHAGWAKEIAQQINTTSARQFGASLGANALHRVILLGVCVLTLFFLFRDGATLLAQARRASHRLFGEKGEEIAKMMAATVHGTVAGLVLVGIGEGVAMGLVYVLTHLPHPILFGLATAIAAMIPFAAAFVIGLAALVLVGAGGGAQAVIVVLSGAAVIFISDHFVRPKIIGDATRLPFLWVLLGILGGVESFQLLGLFIGPAIMAALMSLWRELSSPLDTPSGEDP